MTKSDFFLQLFSTGAEFNNHNKTSVLLKKAVLHKPPIGLRIEI